MKAGKWKKLSACFVISALSLSLCGCRESDEIAKIIYTADATEVDEKQKIQPELSNEVDTALSEKMESKEADDQKENKAPSEGSQENSDGAADSAGGGQAGETGEGGSQKDAHEGSPGDGDGEDTDGEGSETGEVEDDTDENNDGGWEDSPEQDSEEPAPNPEDDTDPENPNDNSSENGDETGRNEDNADSRQVYDDEGNIIDLPSEVNSIAAPGEAGLIVQMLGGEGVLCASSDSFLNNSVAQSVFSDEGIANVAHLWTGDGSAPMDEGSFAALLAMEPDCCIGISGQTNFSSEQIAGLKENDIAYVLVPSMATAANIETAVQIVGEVLGSHEVGDTTSDKLAQAYVDYEQELVNEVRSGQEPLRNKLAYSMYTTVLWDWDPGFRYEYYQNGGGPYISQSGGAVVKLYQSENEDTPVTYYMGAADVCDDSRGETYNDAPSTAMVMVPLYWLVWDGSVEYIASFLQEGIAEEENEEIIEQLPVGNAYECGQYQYFFKKGIYDAGASSITQIEYSGNPGPVANSVNDIRLGQERFPCLIAATNEIKANVEASKADPLGLYRIRPWGIEVPGIKIPPYEKRPNDFHPDEIVNYVNTISTSRWDYGIYVNPCGAGSWLYGSVESFLETAWTRNLFFGEGVYSAGELERVIREFYQTFYRCDDAPLGDILDGI